MFLGGMCVCVCELEREGADTWTKVIMEPVWSFQVAVTQVSGNTRFNFSFS